MGEPACKNLVSDFDKLKLALAISGWYNRAQTCSSPVATRDSTAHSTVAEAPSHPTAAAQESAAQASVAHHGNVLAGSQVLVL